MPLVLNSASEMPSVISSLEGKGDGGLEDVRSFWMTQGKEIMEGGERGTTTSHSVNSLLGREWTWCKTARNT